MTNNEIIKFLQSKQIPQCGDKEYTADEEYEAYQRAIDALEQQPSDTVSRGAFEQVMWERDVAIGQLKELGYGLGQKVEPCDNAISRQAELDGLASIAKAKAKSDAQKTLMGRVMFFTEQLPPVTPQQKYGKWIVDRTVVEKTRQYVTYECGYRRIINYHMDVHCSECGFKYAYTTDKEDSIPTNYCPNCGCRMVEPQESEKKE